VLGAACWVLACLVLACLVLCLVPEQHSACSTRHEH